MAKSNTTTDASPEVGSQDEPTFTENFALVKAGTTSSEMFYRIEGHLTVDDGHGAPLWEERTEEWEKSIPENMSRTSANLVAIREGLKMARSLDFVNAGVSTDSLQVWGLLEEDEATTESRSNELIDEVNDLREQFNGPTVVIWFPLQLME